MAMFVNTREANFYVGNATSHLGGQKEDPAAQTFCYGFGGIRER